MRQKRFTIVTVLLIITIVSTTNVFAYVRFNQGYYMAPNIPIRYYGTINTNYKAEFQDAIDSWNSSSDANIYFSSTSENLIMQSDLVTTSPAEYCYRVGGTCLTQGSYIGYTKFEIYLNDYVMSSYSSSAIQSSCCHELGHALKLDHTYGNPTESIMYTRRNRTQIYEPQQDDINGVNAI